jgi:5-formyltetrahydrofolate cyclo-ligase
MAKSQSSDRKHLLGLRKALSVEQVRSLSLQICKRFLESACLEKIPKKRWVVGLYRAFQSELDLSFLEIEFQKMGALLAYPRIAPGDSKQIEFVDVGAKPELGWQVSPYGFHEPHPELPVVDPKSLDLFFIPGVGFGEAGQRIGRGAGHYDRFLENAPQALRVALAYDFQLLPHLQQNPWDQPVHWIVTERREIRLPLVSSWYERSQNDRKEIEE